MTGKDIFSFVFSLPKRLVLFLIHLYQMLLSPDHSFWAKSVHAEGYCRFTPSCSDYTKQAILKYGLVVGVLKGIWRVLRCNPWNAGGVDTP